jgi:ATP-dependent Clp protease protease subunit
MDEVLAEHTGKTVEQIHTDTERDYFLGSEEAKAYGIIDKVVEER